MYHDESGNSDRELMQKPTASLEEANKELERLEAERDQLEAEVIEIREKECEERELIHCHTDTYIMY